jgi:hypothetical protein
MTGVPTMAEILNGCVEYSNLEAKAWHRWKLDPTLFDLFTTQIQQTPMLTSFPPRVCC